MVFTSGLILRGMRAKLLLTTLLFACGGSAPPPDRASAAPAVQLAFPNDCARGEGGLAASVAFVTASTEVDAQEILFRYQEEYGLPSRAMTRDELAEDASAEQLLGELAQAELGIAVGVTDRPFATGEHWRREGAVGVVSLAELRSEANPAAAYSRMYKLITRVLGEAYCGFSPNERPRSIMFQGLDSVSALDEVDESVW